MNTFDSIDRCIDNLRVVGAQRELERRQRKADALDAAYRSLRDELIDALAHEPAREVSTPGAHKPSLRAFEVIEEAFAGRDGEAVLVDLLRIVGEALKSEDPFVRIPAQAWVSARADKYAEFHAGDLIAEDE